MIRNTRPNLILALLQLLHIPKMLLPPRKRAILPLQHLPLHIIRNTRPHAPAEIRRQCRPVHAYPAICARGPVLLRQLAVRYRFDRVVYAAWRVVEGVVFSEQRGREVRGAGVVRDEFRVARVEACDAVAEEEVCA